MATPTLLPATPLHPAPIGTWLRASRSQLLLRLPGRWGSHGCAFPESRHFHHMQQTCMGIGKGCELGWLKTQEERERERERVKGLGVGSRLSEGSLAEEKCGTGRGNSGGGWRRSRKAPGSHIPHSSQITLQLLPPNPKVLELQGATHCSLLRPAL